MNDIIDRRVRRSVICALVLASASATSPARAQTQAATGFMSVTTTSAGTLVAPAPLSTISINTSSPVATSAQLSGGSLAVSGNSTMSGNVSVGGTLSAASLSTSAPLSTSGQLSGGTLAVSGNSAMTGNLSVGGTVSATASSPWNISSSVYRTVTSGAYPGGPAMFVNDENQSNSYQQYCCGINNGAAALQINRTLDAGTNGSHVGVTVNMSIAASNPFSDEDVDFNAQINKTGSDSSWGFSGQTNDETGMPPQTFSAVGLEYDINVNGQDNAASAYDPQDANRWFIYLAPKVYGWGSWAASTAESVGAVVVANNPSGVSSIYRVTTAGTTGSSAPTWPASGTVTDGTAVWTYEETNAAEVGTAIWLDNGESSSTSYGTGLGTNGKFLNAVIDTSLATLANSGTAAIRIAANQPIDLSGNATAAGQNQHVLEYATSNSQNSLVYNNAGGTVFRVADAKDWAYFDGPSSLGMYNCGGMTSGFPTSGSTMCWNVTNGSQETDLITGQGGLNVYPVSSTGTISSVPNFTIQSNGNVGVVGTLTVTGNATLAGSVKAASIPVTVQTGAYSFTSGDCGTKVWDYGGTAAHTYTVPSGLPAGCQIDIVQATAAQITIAAGSGETLGIASGFSAALGGQWSHARVDVMTAAIADLHP